MTTEKTIPVCACATPDPAPDFPFPICCGCGRLIPPPSMASRVRVEGRLRDDDFPCPDCHESLLSGSHGRGVCVGPAVPCLAGYEPGRAQR